MAAHPVGFGEGYAGCGYLFAGCLCLGIGLRRRGAVCPPDPPENIFGKMIG